MTKSTTQKIFAAVVSIAMVLTLVVGVAVSSANAQTASAMSSYAYSRSLTVGSTGADVTALQSMLNAGGYLSVAPTGYFGSLTKAALAKWQAAVGISPASGYFGPITRSYIAMNGSGSTGGVSTVPGCTAGALFSSTTGAPCTTTSVVPGCTAGAMYSSTTGQPCSGSTGGVTGGTLDNTDGSISVSTSSYVSTGLQLKKGDTKDVVGIRLQATAGKVAVSRLDVHFSVRPWLFFSQVQLHDSNGNVIATKPISSAADATEITVGSDYLVRFDNLNYVVTPGTNPDLAVSVTVLPATDKITNGMTVYAGIPSGAIRTINGKGFTDSIGGTAAFTGTSNPGGAGESSFTLASTGSVADIFARISPSTPAARQITTSATQTTTNQVLGVFSLKSANNASTLNTLTLSINGTTTPGSMFNNIRLIDPSGATHGGTLGTTVGWNTPVTFSNLTIPLTQDTWTDFTLEADIPSGLVTGTASTTLVANSTNIVATDVNYNTATVESSTATSNNNVLTTAGIAITNASVTRGSAITQSNSTTGYNETFAFTVNNTSNSDIYISKTPSVALGTSTNITPASTTALTSVTTSPSTQPGDTTSSYDVPAGTTRTFTYSGAIRGSSGSSVRLTVTQINYGVSDGANTASNINFGLDALTDTVSF